MAILKQTAYSVTSEGSLVKIQLGGIPVTLDYSTALEMAQMLRIEGRRAKAIAGDKSFTVIARGMLSDAETDEKLRQSLRDSTAKFRVS